MFEVIVTYRVDLSERAVDRYPTEKEAQERARQLALQHYDKIARTWVRVIRPVKNEI